MGKQRLTILIMGMAVLVSISLPRPARAAWPTAIVVNTVADEQNSSGNCSLREAIQAANLDTPIDACVAGSGADIILLPAGTYNLTLGGAGEDAAAGGDLDIRGDLTITGAGAAGTIIDAGERDRVFDIAGAFTVNIAALTIRNGNAALNGGGAILNVISVLTLTDIHITTNTSLASGGGIRNNDGKLTLRNSTLSGNSSNASGGAIFTAGAKGELLIVNSTISGNTAHGSGGGINVVGGVAKLNNATITNNSADDDRDGVGDGGGISGAGDTLSVKNSILARNGDTGNQAADCAGSLTSEGYNLITEPRGCTVGGDTTGQISGQDPNLGPLQDNGGATPTAAPLPGSPTIDTGSPATPGTSNSACEAKDQREMRRPQGARCDMGAVEFVLLPVIASLIPASATAGGGAFTLTIDGAGFDRNSTVRWNNADRATTLISDTQLVASIAATDIVAPGKADIVVFNSAHGYVSNELRFAIQPPKLRGGRIFLPAIALALPPCNDIEPNDDQYQARPLTTLGGECTGSLKDDMEEEDDWYSLDLGVGQHITIKLTINSVGANYDLYLYGAGNTAGCDTNKLLDRSDKSGQTTEAVSYGPTTKGTYCIRIQKWHGVQETDLNNYTLSAVAS